MFSCPVKLGGGAHPDSFVWNDAGRRVLLTVRSKKNRTLREAAAKFAFPTCVALPSISPGCFRHARRPNARARRHPTIRIPPMNPHPILPTLACLAAFSAFSLRAAAAGPVKLSEVDEVIPTYLMDPPDPNPMFYFGSESQGAQGRIYPYPLYDNLTNTKAGRTYHEIGRAH